MQLNDSQIIELLGGTTKVAKLCNVSLSSVTHWKSRGIPVGQLMFLAARLEKESEGLLTRREMFPKSFLDIWPELAKNKQ